MKVHPAMLMKTKEAEKFVSSPRVANAVIPAKGGIHDGPRAFAGGDTFRENERVWEKRPCFDKSKSPRHSTPLSGLIWHCPMAEGV
jgi:hypothetical protein